MEVGEQVAAQQQQQQNSDESSGGNGSLPKGQNPTARLELSATSASKDTANGQPLIGMTRLLLNCNPLSIKTTGLASNSNYKFKQQQQLKNYKFCLISIRNQALPLLLHQT